MTVDREAAVAFAEGYGRTWERWDREGWVGLFSDDVVYVVHPTHETVVGKEALGPYFEKEAAEQGEVNVRIGNPVVEGDHVTAEFWVTSVKEDATLTGCFIARLNSAGLCSLFREYWFNIDEHVRPYEGWGE
jgi:ketosteroid isomerase-like protein